MYVKENEMDIFKGEPYWRTPMKLFNKYSIFLTLYKFTPVISAKIFVRKWTTSHMLRTNGINVEDINYQISRVTKSRTEMIHFELELSMLQFQV